MTEEVIRGTFSLCPVCLTRIPAYYAATGDEAFMKKTCREHGDFSTVVWRGLNDIDMKAWGAPGAELTEKNCPPCPSGCGLCDEHIRDTCCIMLEVTGRCNLMCKYCFAGERAEADDPPLETVLKQISDIAGMGKTFLQLSGGEPTLRDDLPEIVLHAKQCGFEYIQLNSNGLRLAEDDEYVLRLANAGLSFVFMQFDGTKDDINIELRGQPLFLKKRKAVSVCAKYNLGVSFVSTVVPGVNDDNIGDFIRMAVSLSPMVRGVHFQPVSYFGRYPAVPVNDMRITLPEILREIEKQTNGQIALKNFSASCCDHPLCGFHGDFVVMPDGLHSLRPAVNEACDCETQADDGEVSSCCGSNPAKKNQRFVGRRWKRRESCCESGDAPADLTTLDGFLDRVSSHGFTITAMAFQDCFNIDLERLRRCSMHVYDGGKVIPLCVRYLTYI